MSEVIENENTQENSCEDRCYNHLNFCNDLVYTFGINKGCRKQDEALETTGATQIGYAVNKGKLKDIKIVWSGEHDAFEQLIITRNGKQIASTVIEGPSGTLCVETSAYLCDCDVINVFSTAVGVEDEEGNDMPGEWLPAGCITVSLWIEPKCKTKPHPEGDGIAEAFDTTGFTGVLTGDTWYTRTLDTERLNTIPGYVSFDDSTDSYKLKAGIYKITYETGIEFDQSVAVDYYTKLEVNDGSGWVDYPNSSSADYCLAGSNGNVVASRTVTMKVDHDQELNIRISEMISKDTSIQSAGAGGSLVIERVANGLGL